MTLEMELVEVSAFDPSKWFINILSLFGLTKNLRRTKDYLIFMLNFNLFIIF